MSKDYYNILGVDRNATDEQIKKAYRKMAMKYHPDKNNGDIDSENKFKEAAEAYDVLSDSNKKSNYDRFGSANGNPFGGDSFGGSGFGFEDIFSQFGDMFGGGNRWNARQRQKRGSDLRIKVSLTIDEVINGVNKKLKYKRQDKCQPCNGKGGTDIRDCIPCNGTGERISVQNSMFGQIRTQGICSDCNGSGKRIQNPCGVCKGDGTTIKEEVVDVQIPVGVSAGMQLGMSGYGNHIRDGVPGDLKILIDEIREFYFKREGNSLIVEKQISAIDAIIGSNVKVKTPHGEIPIVIEPGTEHGKTIRVTGKGIPDINLGLGDLFIKISLKIPKNITQEEKEVLEKLKDSKNFQV